MNLALPSSLDTFPIWLTLAAAAFFGIIVLITLLRAERSVANGALTVITLLAIGVAVAATIRGFGLDGRIVSAENRPVQPASAALSCIDDLAGDAVLNACEKTLFGSAESAAAAVAYAASQISRLTSSGDIATAERNMTPELEALRRAVERDRYGLMAYVLMARDHCTPSACAAFRSLGDYHQIVSNMDAHLYENLITRYASSWNASAPTPAGASGLVAALPPSVPTGKPTNAEFPTAASTPPVNIMTPEPPAPSAPKPAPAAATAGVPAPRPAPAAATAVAKKQTAAKRPAAAPVQLAPASPAPAPPAPASAPADSND
ncbi:MAG: hypothetical protein ACJ8FZ_05830 [Bradyrhizobium sp.]